MRIDFYKLELADQYPSLKELPEIKAMQAELDRIVALDEPDVSRFVGFNAQSDGLIGDVSDDAKTLT
jgi:hypothetical protein